MTLTIVPITLKDARRFVDQNHRHHRAPQGGLFAAAAARDGTVVGVAIIGRPIARHNADGWTAEVTRLCTDGTRNACSILYAASWRAARALGYRRLITYTLDTEPGTSLRAAGWHVVGQTTPEGWSRPSRPRIDQHTHQSKIKWEIAP